MNSTRDSPSAELDSIGEELKAMASAPPVGEALAEGEIIAESFRVERVLGRGGMGVVYLAHDETLDRAVALKVQRAGVSDRAAHRMAREAKAMARLAHPNVVPIHEVGHHRGTLFIAMEFVGGGNLREWVKAKRRTTAEILAAFRGAGKGLLAAHRIGLVHRDFKPENVMIDEDGRAQVADFGLALSVGASQDGTPSAQSDDALERRVTQTGAAVGTREYMSPERYAGGAADPRADQYSFCVALFEALHGVRPAEGEPQTARKVPAAIMRAVRRGLQTDPDDRYASMEDLLRDLSWRPRSRWWLGAGVGGLAGAAALTVFATRQESPCAAASSQLGGVWSDEARADAKAGLAAVGKAYAAEVFERVDPQLREYATAWDNAYAGACQARHVRQELSAELYDKQIACLDAGRRSFAALVDALRVPTNDVAFAAVSDAAGLPSIPPCSDLEALQAIDPLPEGADAQAQVVRLTEALRDFELEEEGRPTQELRAELVGLVEECTATGYAPLSARAKLRLSTFDAYHHLPNADVDAVPKIIAEAVAAGDYKLAANAADRMAGQYNSTDPPRAREWTAIGHGFLERSPSPQLRRNLQRDEAFSYMYEANWDAAERLLQQVLEETAAEDEDHIWLGRAYEDLAALENRRMKNDKALEYAKLSYDAFARSRGELHPLTAGALANLGRTHASQGQFKEAMSLMSKARDQLAAAYGPDHRQPVGADLSLGQIAALTGDWATARTLLERALGFLKSGAVTDSVDLVLAQMELALVRAHEGDLEAARALARDAIEDAREDGTPAFILMALDVQTRVELRAGGLEIAEAAAREMIQLVEKAKLPAREATAAWWALGEAARMRGDNPKAAHNFNKALEVCGEEETLARGRARFGLAQVGKGDHHAQTALAFFEPLPGAEAAEEAQAIRQWLEAR